MPAAPLGPRQDMVHRLRHRKDDAPQQPPNFGHAQRDVRPQLALNAATLLASWGALPKKSVFDSFIGSLTL